MLTFLDNIPRQSRVIKERTIKYEEQGFKRIEEIILPEHKEFRKFIEFLVDIDPRTRPSARKALEHRFLKMDITGEFDARKRKTLSKSKSTKHSSSVPKNSLR